MSERLARFRGFMASLDATDPASAVEKDLYVPTPGSVADELADALREIVSEDVSRVRVGADAFDWVREVHRAGKLLVVSGLAALTPDGWRRLDLLRSGLRREASVVLVASQGTFEQLARHVPNLLSWFDAVYEWDEDAGQLSEQERQERIAALERWSGMPSRDVIARGERGELPPDPEYREWLVLLDRGDLLAHQGRGVPGACRGALRSAWLVRRCAFRR